MSEEGRRRRRRVKQVANRDEDHEVSHRFRNPIAQLMLQFFFCSIDFFFLVNFGFETVKIFRRIGERNRGGKRKGNA